MTYLTYDEYLDMGGTVDETAFTRLEHKARKKINKETFNRIEFGMVNELFYDEEIESIKECVYQLVTMLRNDFSNAEDKVLSSVSNDGVSESYVVFSDIQELNNCMEDTIIDYLSDVYLEEIPVLYRGADEIPKMVDRFDNNI